MQKATIAIVDSGIHLEKANFLISGICNCIDKREDTYLDLNGHGTMCVKTINYINSNNNYYIIKCLDRNLKCSSEELIVALESLLTIDVDIINLSLATNSQLYYKEFKNVCEKLKAQGKILISSVTKENYHCMPASISSVIGVEGKYIGDHFRVEYIPNAEIQCIADASPLIIKYQKSFLVFAGHSKATACVSGIVSKKKLYDNVEKANVEPIVKNIYDEEKNIENRADLLREILIDEIGESYLINSKSLLNSGINKWNVSRILTKIEQSYDVDLPDVITLEYLESEKTIMMMIAESMAKKHRRE